MKGYRTIISAVVAGITAVVSSLGYVTNEEAKRLVDAITIISTVAAAIFMRLSINK